MVSVLTTPMSITIRRRIRPISTICTRLRSRLYDTEAAGSLPDWCQSIADSGDDIWLNFYVSKTDDTLLIEDMDGIGLFGTTDPVPYYRAQNM